MLLLLGCMLCDEQTISVLHWVSQSSRTDTPRDILLCSTHCTLTADSGGSTYQGACLQVYSLQLGSWKWTEHTSEVEGDAPAPRSGHTAVALPDGRHLALFGGGDSDKDLFYANVAVLDTLTWQWSTPKLQVWLTSTC